MPHFHLSLQAGDDMILKRMKRRHSRADAVRTVERIKAARPDATIGADLIAGFPTETEEMALNSLKLLDDCDVVAAHVFPFSPRPEHAGGADAAASARAGQGARRTAAQAAAAGASTLARQSGRHDPARADRKRRQGSHRQFRAGRDRGCRARRRRAWRASPAATAII